MDIHLHSHVNTNVHICIADKQPAADDDLQEIGKDENGIATAIVSL